MTISENSPQSSREATINEQVETATKMHGKDPQEALALAEAAMRAAERYGYPHAYARALNVRARCYGVMGNIDASSLDYHTCLERAQLLEDQMLQSQCLHGLGNVHFYRGEFALALEYMHRAIALRRIIADENGLMVSLNGLGAFLTELGDFANAVTYITASLQIARRLGDKTNEAMAMCNIGYAKLELGEFDQAIVYLTSSVRLMNEVGSRIYEPIALENLAKAHYRLGQWDKALDIGQQAVQVSLEIGNQHLEVNSLCVIAMIQRDKGETTTAEQSLLHALQLAQDIQAGKRIAEICCALGRLYLDIADFESARHYLEAGLTCGEQTQQKQHVSDLHLALSELFAATGDYKHALESHRAYYEMYRVQQKESAQNRLAAQLASLEVERAQQQAEIHRLRNVELVAANRRNAELLERLQQHANQLTELATKDPLTGLYNRRYLQDYLYRELEETRYLPHLSVAVADLDNFKQVNDRFSHRIGDEVLKAVAQLIQSTIRHSDVAVRFGGEEFVIVLPDTLRSEAIEVCERVRSAIAAYEWRRVHPELKMTTSMGVADSIDEALDRVEADSPGERLLALADQRLYRAKEYGKNRVVGGEKL